MSSFQPNSAKVFISYSHRDEEWLERLETHLRPLEREHSIECFYDKNISPGDNWEEEIKKAIVSAKFIVLLISANYLSSDYIANEELPPILDAFKAKKATIFALIISPCRFERTEHLSEIQTINSPSRPLEGMPRLEQESFFDQLIIEIERRLITEIDNRRNEDPTTSLEPEMIHIQTGMFWMGSPESEEGRYADERLHEVRIQSPFAIGKYPVTFEEYDRFAEATKSRKPEDEEWGRNKRPVINVSWFDAMEYANWLSEKTGRKYRLPTEAEWEYAARAGTGSPYCFGSTIRTQQAHFGDLSAGTLEIGKFPPNNWGLYDTLGNVWEWTCSRYDRNYAGEEQICTHTSRVAYRVVARGGAWNTRLPRDLRVAARKAERPRVRKSYLGFRLVRIP